MDCVILAAGRNTRLNGIIPPYYKPLLVVNGQTLISQLSDLALLNCGKVIIVAAPENILPISQVLGNTRTFRHGLHIVAQPYPDGPGGALMRGLELCTAKQTMIICADNVISNEDFIRVRDESIQDADKVYVCGRAMPVKEATRFARLSNGKLIEGEPGGDIHDGYQKVWLGPLVVPTGVAQDVFRLAYRDRNTHELKIAPHINDFHKKLEFIPVDCYDIGVPEEVTSFTKMEKALCER